MATTYEGPIQDLNTNNVSFLAYYPVDEIKTGMSFNPEDLQFGDSDGRLQPQKTYLYDNAIKIEINDTYADNTITLRAGNDDHKWVTAHLDSYSSDNGGEFTHDSTGITDPTNFQYYGDPSSLKGAYDLMPWTIADSGYDSSQNTLFNVINETLSRSDFWDRSSLDTSKSGIYNYDAESDNISIFGAHGGRGDGKGTYGFSYTDSTRIHSAYFVGSIQELEVDELTIYVDGTRIYNSVTDGYFANNITKIVDNQKQFTFKATDTQNRTALSSYCIVSWS